MRYIIFFFFPFLLNCSNDFSKAEQPHPNIILINIDDLGWKDLGFMGSEYYETPNIDKLSQQGMKFTNGYASAANCAPSRACLMTGKWSTRHGIYTVGSSKRGKSKLRKLIPIENKTTLSKSHMILPEILRQNGYSNIHAGKWHLSKNPLNYAFDINIGGGHNGHPKSYYPPYINVDLEGDKHLTNMIMERTIDALDTIGSPFFLNYSPYAVHTPIQPIDSLMSKYKSKVSWNGQNNSEYATMIENLDSNIGLLIRTLEHKKILKNTLIIFTSDNGGLFGITNQHPLRAGKGSYYEGGIRVPMFFVWKGKIMEGGSCNIPVTNLDFFPTILGILNINQEKRNLDGSDISSILLGKISKLDRPLFWHFPIYLQAYKVNSNENRDSLFRTRPGSVIRKGKWKLHYYFENNETELYNLDNDISERNNLVNTKHEKTEELLIDLQNWWKKTNAPVPKNLNPDYITH